MSPIPYPKMLYHPKTGIGTIVQNEIEHEKLLETWTAPETVAEKPDEPPAPKEKISAKSAA